jgi:2',3'-cyclic-nucleotide 2'-phosphodiesterase/3'-nucleotidase
MSKIHPSPKIRPSPKIHPSLGDAMSRLTFEPVGRWVNLGLGLGMLGILGIGALGTSPVAARDIPVTLTLRIMATTDIHANLMDYDYYRDQPDPAVGLVRVASLIKKARTEQPNSILLDDGDLIQGAPVADQVHQAGLAQGQIHPVFQAMNRLGYDAATLGNHEFNYGLDFLEKSLAGARFPYVSANVIKYEAHAKPHTLVAPSVLLKRRFRDILGRYHWVQIGIIGETPPQIMNWDRDKLTGRIDVLDPVTAVSEAATRLKAEGADVVIVLAHTGIGPAEPEKMGENTGWQFTKIRGVDAVVLGHSHQVFPSDSYANVLNADLDTGTINGKPVVMAGYFGSHLGIIDLVLKRRGRHFVAVSGSSIARPIQRIEDGHKVSTVESDPALVKLLEPVHQKTIAYAHSPVAQTQARIQSYLALMGDNTALALIQDAERAYVQEHFKNPADQSLPVLAGTSPFKAGGRYGPNNYTDIAPGEIQLRNISDLYPYPNTLSLVKVTGAELREWLEMASRVFNRIDPAITTPQPLIDQRVPAYDFDVIDGITYQIDLTKPSRYDQRGKVIHEESHRIIGLSRNGQPISDDAEFLVATSNYRADGGGSFPGLNGSKTVMSAPDTIPDMLTQDFIRKREVALHLRPIWTFVPLPANVRVTFELPTREAALVADDTHFQRDVDLPTGFTRYYVTF